MGNAWRDVEAGRRKLDWAVAIGDPTELDFLTPLGRQTAARMADDLEKFFGPGWLHKAVHPTGGVAGPTMGPYYASLAGVGAFAPWWACGRAFSIWSAPRPRASAYFDGTCVRTP
jgi:hypothetical protein